MSNARYLWIHECETPKMYKEVMTEEPRRTWYGKKYVETITNYEYDKRTVRWRCPECNSDWEWRGGMYLSFWRCMNRPEVWKGMDL